MGKWCLCSRKEKPRVRTYPLKEVELRREPAFQAGCWGASEPNGCVPLKYESTASECRHEIEEIEINTGERPRKIPR